MKTCIFVFKYLNFDELNRAFFKVALEYKDRANFFYADIENADSTADADDDSVISLDDAALEEEQDTKN